MPEDAVSVVVFVLTRILFFIYPVGQVVIINLKRCNLQVSYKYKGGQSVCAASGGPKQHQTSERTLPLFVNTTAATAAGKQQR